MHIVHWCRNQRWGGQSNRKYTNLSLHTRCTYDFNGDFVNKQVSDDMMWYCDLTYGRLKNPNWRKYNYLTKCLTIYQEIVDFRSCFVIFIIQHSQPTLMCLSSGTHTSIIILSCLPHILICTFWLSDRHLEFSTSAYEVRDSCRLYSVAACENICLASSYHVCKSWHTLFRIYFRLLAAIFDSLFPSPAVLPDTKTWK